MDIKIGLLVKNRIDVEEVVAHGKHLNRRIRDRTKSKLYTYFIAHPAKIDLDKKWLPKQ